MIDREHDLPIVRQADALNISRGSVYYLPRPVPDGPTGWRTGGTRSRPSRKGGLVLVVLFLGLDLLLLLRHGLAIAGAHHLLFLQVAYDRVELHGRAVRHCVQTLRNREQGKPRIWV